MAGTIKCLDITTAYYIKQYDLCKSIMFESHNGQTRHDGITPYVVHPLALADNFETPFIQCVCFLHDVVEDCDVTTSDLLDRGVDGYIVELVEQLTHKTGQSYDDYIDQVCENSVAVKIKLADMLINLADSPTRNQKKKYQKYAQQLFKELP